MREILFRSWVEDHYENNVPVNKNGKYSKCVSTGFALQYDPSYKEYDVEQYTGLKDKHGTMIFEGDIFISDYFKDGEKFNVVSRHGAFCGESNRTGIFPLGFNNDYYETGDEDDDFYYPDDYTPHIEVVGNIHDQKEDV